MLRALLVDDEPHVRSALAREARNAGFTAEVAASAREALALAKHCDYRVVTLDQHMHGMDGLEDSAQERRGATIAHSEVNAEVNAYLLSSASSYQVAKQCEVVCPVFGDVWQDTQLLTQMDELTSRYGANPSQLILSFAEDELLKDPLSVGRVLSGLRQRGFGLALSDFGSGWSSLSTLVQLPLSELVIDAQVVAGIGSDQRRTALCSLVIDDVGKRLALRVVADGVEYPDQRRFLAEEGCHLAQGALLGAPQRIEKPAER